MTPPTPAGLLVVDKPAALTSRAAVDRALRWFPRQTRIGHTGTLDPLATGVLVLTLGHATRLTEYVQRMSKTYRAGIRLGAISDTDDAEGIVTAVANAGIPDLATLKSCLGGFLGETEQVPPAFSAAKVAGARAYDLARGGKEVSLAPRRVTIYSIEILRYEPPELEVEVRCGKGTYIRSLARDLGGRLGCGGYITSLRRTRVGPFAEAEAVSLDSRPEDARTRLLPAGLALGELPRVELPPADAERLRSGQAVKVRNVAGVGEEVGVFDASGNVVAVGRYDRTLGILRPEKVLATA